MAAWHDFSPKSATFCSGTHLAVVEVDAETGEIHLLRYAAVDDSGAVLNHYLADAQVHGGLAQGIGESGTVAAPPTIVNAVLDALAPTGVHNINMPLKPERVWASIEGAHQRRVPEAEPVPPAILSTLKGE